MLRIEWNRTEQNRTEQNTQLFFPNTKKWVQRMIQVQVRAFSFPSPRDEVYNLGSVKLYSENDNMLLYVCLRVVSFRVKIWVTYNYLIYPKGSFVLRVRSNSSGLPSTSLNLLIMILMS